MIIAIAFISSCTQKNFPASTPIINSEIKNQSQQTILAGHCSVSILQTGNYKTWYDKSYNDYTIDSTSANELKSLLQNKTIEIFLGSWCGDSKREVPRLMKVLDYIQFDTSRLKLIFVDNSTATYKQSPQHEEQGKFIHHVPSIIVYYKNKEIGRIVERPIISLEKDLLAITKNETYVPNYKAASYWQKHVTKKNKPLSDDEIHSLAVTIKPLCADGMREFNALGYVILAQKKFTEAINIFRLNTILFPADSGTYDSLGEAYMVTGDKERAKYYYNKVLEMKPGDENAIKVLEKLK